MKHARCAAAWKEREGMPIQARLDGDTILATADDDSLRVLQRMAGAKRVSRTSPVWRLPLGLEMFRQLREYGAQMDAPLLEQGRRAENTQRWIEQTKASQCVEPIKPVPVKPGVTLYAHQVKAYNIGYILKNFAALLDMGTGKSLTTVAITGRRFLDGKISRVLIVAPTSVCAVWPREYQQFADFPHRVVTLLGERDKRLAALRYLQQPVMPGMREPLRVAVINYESTWRLEKELIAYKPDMIVCDESQRIKSHAANQSKAMHRIGDIATYKMILTGTPVQNNTLDVWSQWRFLSPSIFGTSFYPFEKRYAVMGGVGNHQYMGTRNLPELTRKAHSIAYRVTKEECLDLPEQTFEDRIVALDEKSMRLYKRIQTESFAALENGEAITANNILVRLLRLQQITGGFLKSDDGAAQVINTAKLDALADIVEGCCVDEGRKLVIFARFRAELEAILARVHDVLGKASKSSGKPLGQVAIWGDIPIPQRGAIVKQFQEDPATRVFVGQIDACAEGITLTAANTVAYYSVNWNLSKYQQSLARIHRIGQRNACTYIHLVVPGTVDEKIMKALKAKEDLARSIVDNWKDYFMDE